jgi:hypothetical protein
MADSESFHEETEQPDAEEVKATELLARAQGWKPQDKWTREDIKWVDAKTYVERGTQHRKNLQREVETLRQKIGEFEGTKEAFKKFHEETVKAKDAELSAAINELKIQRNRATREGEDAEAVELENRIDTLKQQQTDLKQEVKAATKQPENTQTAPELDAWIEDGNQWFKNDEKLRDYSVALARELKKSDDSLSGRALLDKVRSVMEVDFPHKFGKSQRAASVESGGGRSATSGHGKTARDLPEEDRKLMEHFDKEGWVKKEDFLKNYRWEN